MGIKLKIGGLGLDIVGIEKETGEVSDGYHTFNELYDHRCLLFIATMKAHPDISWKSWKHSDGERWAGWFIAGMNLPSGAITYHIPEKFWALASITECERGFAWDGHTSVDVIERLIDWLR